MRELNYTLLADGSSDQALIPILTWLLREQGVERPIQPEWADLRRLHRPPKDLSERIECALSLYPCDLLFVHRDAERQSHESRMSEIRHALEAVTESDPRTVVCVVPVRMTEAWLLSDEVALRRAAGNPNGQQGLDLPPIAELERLADPKARLYTLLRKASGLKGRRRRQFPDSTRAQRITAFMHDFAPLRHLPAFRALEGDVQRVVDQRGWAAETQSDPEAPLRPNI